MRKANEERVDYLLDKEITRVIRTMSQMNIESDEYRTVADQLGKLYNARSESPRKAIDPNVVVAVATSVAEILLILNFEKIGVVTSKAMGRIVRGRI